MPGSSRPVNRALSLYRSILREHKIRLPLNMRHLGDSYVKQEFRLHQNANPQQVNGFIISWENYLQTLKTQGPGSFGRDIEAEEVRMMNDDQKVKMEKMKEEAIRRNKP